MTLHTNSALSLSWATWCHGCSCPAADTARCTRSSHRRLPRVLCPLPNLRLSVSIPLRLPALIVHIHHASRQRMSVLTMRTAASARYRAACALHVAAIASLHLGTPASCHDASARLAETASICAVLLPLGRSDVRAWACCHHGQEGSIGRMGVRPWPGATAPSASGTESRTGSSLLARSRVRGRWRPCCRGWALL